MIHALLATAITTPALAEYRIRQRERLDDLVAMLETNGAPKLPDIPQATDAALQLGDELLLPTNDEMSLLGPCYVLEGSHLGGQLLRDHLAKALDLLPNQVAYHAASGKEVRQRWDAFRHDLDAMKLTEEQANAVIRAATMTFDGIGALAQASYPLDPEELRPRLSTINPEAGRHAIRRVRPMLPERCVAAQRHGDAFLTSKCVTVTVGDASPAATAAGLSAYTMRMSLW